MSNLDRLRSLLGADATRILHGLCQRPYLPMRAIPSGNQAETRLLEALSSRTTAQYLADLLANLSGGRGRNRRGAVVTHQRADVLPYGVGGLVGHILSGAQGGAGLVSVLSGDANPLSFDISRSGGENPVGPSASYSIGPGPSFPSPGNTLEIPSSY